MAPNADGEQPVPCRVAPASCSPSTHTIQRLTSSRNRTQHKLNIQDRRPASATGRGGGTQLPLQKFCSKGTCIPLLVCLSRSLSYITPTIFYYKKGGNLILTHPPIDCPPIPLPTRCIILRLLPAHHFFLSVLLYGPVPCLW